MKFKYNNGMRIYTGHDCDFLLVVFINEKELCRKPIAIKCIIFSISFIEDCLYRKWAF